MGTIVFVSITLTCFAVLIAWVAVNHRATPHRGTPRGAAPSLSRQGRHRGRFSPALRPPAPRPQSANGHARRGRHT